MSGELILGRIFDLAVEEVLSDTARRLLHRRTTAVRALLIEDLRNSGVSLAEAAERDEVVSMMITLVEALRQGAATRNLRIIARILAGKAANPAEGTEDFIAWSDAIKGLTYKDISFLLTHWRRYSEMRIEDAAPGGDPVKVTRDKILRELVGEGKLLQSTAEYEMYGYSLLRTGFVTMMSLISDFNVFVPTSRLSRLVEMARLDEWAETELAETE
jgi:hypothetical protein